jgi:hypothetical protein
MRPYDCVRDPCRPAQKSDLKLCCGMTRCDRDDRHRQRVGQMDVGGTLVDAADRPWPFHSDTCSSAGDANVSAAEHVGGLELVELGETVGPDPEDDDLSVTVPAHGVVEGKDCRSISRTWGGHRDVGWTLPGGTRQSGDAGVPFSQRGKKTAVYVAFGAVTETDAVERIPTIRASRLGEHR